MRALPLIRWMRPDEEAKVRACRRVCHQSGDDPLDGFYVAHPTLVVEVKGRVIAFTSFTLSPTEKGYVCYGVDLCVRPDNRRQGIGRALHEERCRIAKEHGATAFVGTVEPGNEPMIRLLDTAGFPYASSAEGRHFHIGDL